MLKRAEPPICVGLYARWGSGKTFMISLLKKEFDKTVREDPVTKQLLQFFEEGYEKLVPADEPKPESIGFLICGLLLNILHAFMPTVPYWMSTILSIIWDVLDFRKGFSGFWLKYTKTKVAVSDDEREPLLKGDNKSQDDTPNPNPNPNPNPDPNPNLS